MVGVRQTQDLNSSKQFCLIATKIEWEDNSYRTRHVPLGSRLTVLKWGSWLNTRGWSCLDYFDILVFPDPNDPIASVLAIGHPGRMSGSLPYISFIMSHVSRRLCSSAVAAAAPKLSLT